MCVSFRIHAVDAKRPREINNATIPHVLILSLSTNLKLLWPMHLHHHLLGDKTVSKGKSLQHLFPTWYHPTRGLPLGVKVEDEYATARKPIIAPQCGMIRRRA